MLPKSRHNLCVYNKINWAPYLDFKIKNYFEICAYFQKALLTNTNNKYWIAKFERNIENFDYAPFMNVMVQCISEYQRAIYTHYKQHKLNCKILHFFFCFIIFLRTFEFEHCLLLPHVIFKKVMVQCYAVKDL